jgi:hypothetical protein
MQEDPEVAELGRRLDARLPADDDDASTQWKLRAIILSLKREKSEAMAIVKRLESELKVSARSVPMLGSTLPLLPFQRRQTRSFLQARTVMSEKQQHPKTRCAAPWALSHRVM